jgi:ferrous iron transport protein A|tara:strand:- start:355 stop:630 length:276 start_codon:yes stop_codon:yes gene_type:complete
LEYTVAHLKRGERGVILEFPDNFLPIKLLELGCLPGNIIELIQVAPLKDPLYINVNGSHIAIRREVAAKICIAPLGPNNLLETYLDPSADE